MRGKTMRRNVWSINRRLLLSVVYVGDIRPRPLLLHTRFQNACAAISPRELPFASLR